LGDLMKEHHDGLGFRQASHLEHKQEFAEIISDLESFGINRDALVRLLKDRDNLPVHFWIHDANYTIVYGNRNFVDTYGDCLNKPCHLCVMGSSNACSCCRSLQASTSHTSRKCMVCKRHGHGYDINIDHTLVTTSKGRSFIVKTALHLEGCTDLDLRPGTSVIGSGKLLFLVVCSACNRVKDDDVWISLDRVDAANPNVRISHGICPECTSLFYPGLLGESGSGDEA